MSLVISIVRFRTFVAITLLMGLVCGALWFGGVDTKTTLAQDATATLSPGEMATVAAAVAAHVYDTFPGTTLDNKWADASDFDCQLQPNNGVLITDNTLSSDAMNCDLEANFPLISFNRLGWVEAQIEVKDNHNHLELNQGIELSSTSLAQPVDLFCGINAGDSEVAAVATGDLIIDGVIKEFYKANDLSVAYNEFHTFRWTIDAANLTATCSVDGEVIEAVPLNRTDGILQAEWLISLSSYRSEGAVGTTSVTNVKIVPS